METGNLPKKDLKVIIVRMIKKIRRMDAESKKFVVYSKDLGNIRNNQR